MSIKWIDSVWLKCCNSRPSGLNTSITLKFYRFILIILLPLALRSVVGFGLSKNVPPFCPICHHLSPPSHFQHLKISFYFFSPSFPGPSPFVSSLPVLERSFWASYPPPFSPCDPTNLSFAPLQSCVEVQLKRKHVCATFREPGLIHVNCLPFGSCHYY